MHYCMVFTSFIFCAVACNSTRHHSETPFFSFVYTNL